MSSHQFSANTRLPAPCIINTGVLVNKQDIQRVLNDLTQVRYIYIEDGQKRSEGEGYIKEVFVDPQRATLVANSAIYLNLNSFDCLELKQSPDRDPYFDLVQDNRQLRLIPLSNPLQEQGTNPFNSAALEVMVAEVLAASWDVQMDDEDNLFS